MRTLCASVIAAMAALPASAAPVELMFGDPADRHVTFEFAEDRSSAEALVIETRRVGNPGASLKIWIDRSQNVLLSTILSEDDCGFDDAGAMCRLTIPGGSADYNRFVAAFKRGLTAHVEVMNSNVMEMQDDISLRGFTASYGQ
jgi:hypothetical protein